MTPLIDADILLHEIGWSGEFKDKETGEPTLLSFERVQTLLDEKIQLICAEVEATEPPILFVSDSEFLEKQRERMCKISGDELVKFTPLFRYGAAKTKPYKGNRKNPKPYHFYNILSYMLVNYNVVVSEDGLEADDMMCIYQSGRDDTIICSRDKDLRICPGWHYSWECGGQRSLGPEYTDKIGGLIKKENGDIYGYGLKFFYYQMLVGDSADNVPGLKGWGKVKAFEVIDPIDDEMQLFNTVKELYKEVMGKESKEYFLEQANLLWMIQEKGKSYEIPRSSE